MGSIVKLYVTNLPSYVKDNSLSDETSPFIILQITLLWPLWIYMPQSDGLQAIKNTILYEVTVYLNRQRTISIIFILRSTPL